MKTLQTIWCAIGILVWLMAIPNTTFAWGEDVVVYPVSGQYYSHARVTVAYDGTIYYGRLCSTQSQSGPMQQWQVLRSTDGGVSFTEYKSAYVNPTDKYTAFDVLAVGNDYSTFGLFVARAFLDTTSGSACITLTRYDAEGKGMTLINEYYLYSNYRGWESISLASDYREKSPYSIPYSFTMAAVKASPYDSIIAWSDMEGGLNLRRVGVTSTEHYFRHVSIAAGSMGAAPDQYGRIGLAFDVFEHDHDQYGGVKVMFIYAIDASETPYLGPYQIGSDLSSYRNPCIAISQNTTIGSGYGEGDMRAMVLYEFDDGKLYGNMCDSIVFAAPRFTKYYFDVSPESSQSKNAHVVFDPGSDQFQITYYDVANHALPYKSKDLSSDGGEIPEAVVPDYSDGSIVENWNIEPRIDIGFSDENVVCGWIENGVSMMDAESNMAAVQENVPENHADLMLYPNPACDIMNLSLYSENDQVVTISIADIEGRVVIEKTENVGAGMNIISMSTGNLNQGNYIVLVSDNRGVVPMKLLVER